MNTTERNDQVDSLADSARYIRIPSRCNGKTMWLSSVTSFANEQPLWKIDHYHDNCEQWLKEPPKPVEFISDDLEDCEKGVPNTKLIDTERLYFRDDFHMTGDTKLMSTGKLYFQDTTTGEMKPFDGVKNITPLCTMRYRGKTWTHPLSTYGVKGHMVTKNFVGVALTDDDYIDVEVGDVMTYVDPDAPECPDSGKTFVWQGVGIGWKEIDFPGYFDTDMASKMTAPEVKYCMNDVAIQANIAKQLEMYGYCLGADFDGDTIMQIKLFKEELQMADKTRFDMYKPKVSKVIFNDPATVVFWTDGTKTIVKCGDDDVFDPEKGVAMACMKKLLGTNETGSNYLDGVKTYISKWEEDNPEENIWTKVFGTLSKMTGEDPINTEAMDIPEVAEGGGSDDN